MKKYKVSGEEYIFRECPFCNNKKWNFQVNISKGLYHCWVCSKGGRVSEIRGYLGLIGLRLGENVAVLEKDEEVFLSLEGCVNVIGVEEVENYFKKRGFTVKDVLDWNVLVKNGSKIVFPLYESGRLVVYVEKDVNDDRWYYPKGVSKRELVWVKFANQGKNIVLVEGLFDAMRVFSVGINVMVMLGKNIFDKDVDYIRNRGLNPILFLDGDVERGIYNRFEKQLEEFECMFIEDKGKDPADLSKEEILGLYKNKKKYGFGDRIRLRMSNA